MSNIPKARDMLADLAPALEPKQREVVLAVLDLLYRRQLSRPKAPAKSRPVDARTAAAIRAYCAAYPSAHHQDVANVFGTNPGRVSEALRYER